MIEIGAAGSFPSLTPFEIYLQVKMLPLTVASDFSVSLCISCVDPPVHQTGDPPHPSPQALLLAVQSHFQHCVCPDSAGDRTNYPWDMSTCSTLTVKARGHDEFSCIFRLRGSALALTWHFVFLLLVDGAGEGIS